MISIKPLLIALLFSVKTLTAQVVHQPYFPSNFGTEWQITNFTKKGILQSSVEAKIVSIKPIDSTGFEGVVEQVFLNKKDEETGANSYRFRSQNNTVFIEMLGVLPPQILGAYQNMNLVSVGKMVEFPDSLVLGQKLPDATVEIQARSGSSIVTKLQFFMTNRVVAGSEPLITAAGSFKNCLRIDYDLETHIGAVVSKRKCSVWLAENVGMVKTEFYKKKKLEGSQQLTAFRQRF